MEVGRNGKKMKGKEGKEGNKDVYTI